MSPWWLLLIVPACEFLGLMLGALLAVIGEEDRREAAAFERETIRRTAVEPAVIRAQRFIPADVWEDKCAQLGAPKAAQAWLRLTMGQQLGASLGPYIDVSCRYREKTNDYEISGAVKVLPREY